MDLIINEAPKSFLKKGSHPSKNQKRHVTYLKRKKDKINNASAQHELPKYNQIGEMTQISESIVSTLNSNYTKKGNKSLSDFTDVPLSKSTILQYKKKCGMLSHIRAGKNVDGRIILDGDDVVAVITIEEKNNEQKWLQTMEITKKYGGYGLSKQLLNLAAHHYGARFLSVNKKNQVAIKLYKDFGFKPYAETDNMIMMSIGITDNIHENFLLEALTRNMKPIFIVNSWTNTPFGKIIRIGTQSTYTHSGIALDTSLDRIYTFNADNRVNKFGGVSVESLQDYINVYDNCRINVECIFVKESDYIIIKNVMDHMVSVQDQTTYDFLNIFNIIFHRATEVKDDTMTLICSQFVVYILSRSDIYITDKPINLTTPKDLVTTIKTNPRVYLLYDGLGKDYDKKKIDRIFRKLEQKAVLIKECSL